MAPVSLTHQDYSVGWVCALKEELAVAIVMLEREHPDLPIPESDRNAYTLGSIGDHNVAIAALPEGDIGNNPAATVATRMTSTFPSIKFWLMVGIGGGVPPKVRLGDVVVGTPVYNLPGVVQWDSGIMEGDSYRRIGTLNKPPEVLLAAIKKLRARHEIRRADTGVRSILEDLRRKEPDFVLRYGKSKDLEDILFETDYNHVVIEGQEAKNTCRHCSREKLVKREPRQAELEIHYGAIASGNSVIKNARERDQIDSELLEGHALCFEMEAADYSDTHKNYDWQKYAALVAAAFAKELLQMIAPSQVKLMLPAAEVLNEINEVRHTIERNLDVTQKIDMDFALSRLPFVNGASFNSSSDESEPCCHPETRTVLLEEIENWTLKSENKCIFWLNGMAGTGKSTISRTVCQKYRHDTTVFDITSHCQLGASFFFKRGEGDRGNASKFFSTLAFQLAQYIPDLRPHLKKALDDDPAISTKVMKEQFEKIILEPLSKLATSLTTLIVIDALDECDDEDHIARIVHLLARIQQVTSVKLRIMITSRPELPVAVGFVKIPNEHRTFILHEIPLPIITHDIGAFLKDELPKIREKYNLLRASGKAISSDWPTRRNIEDLTSMAVPLFIFAATICRFMAETEGWDSDPVGKLNKILQYQSAGSLTRLEKTYLPVLDQILKGVTTGKDRENRVKEFQDIIGSMVILFEPLSITSLANLLDISTDVVDRRLHVLHSVLKVPANPRLPVRVFHLSFRDFLVDAEHKTEFSIDETERDICSLRKPGFLRVDIDIPLLQACLPAEVQYACCYWTHHLERGNHRICDQDEIHSLLSQRFLYWIEALAIIGKLKNSLDMIARLQCLLEPQKSSVLAGFLKDAKHFIFRNREGLDIAPLQLYSSALIFAPATSVVRTMFKKHIPNSIVILPTVQETWSAMLYTLEGHTGEIKSLQFSPNGKLLASGSSNGTIKLWDLASGNLQQTLEGHLGKVELVIFSPDDDGIKQWNIASGILLKSYKIYAKFLCNAFSPDGKQRASGSSPWRISLWDPTSGVLLRNFEKDSDHVTSLAFSPDGTQLASGSHPMINLWDITSGVLLHSFWGHWTDILSLAFSPDGTQLASGSEQDICLWDITSGVLLHSFWGHWTDILSLAFSPDGTQLASGPEQDICLWDMTSGVLLQKFEGHSLSAYSLAFSPDGKRLASGLYSGIKLWDTNSGVLLQKFEGHSLSVSSLAFSPDGKQLASGSSDKTIKMWDIAVGTLLEGHEEAEENKYRIKSVALSRDGKQLASLADSSQIKVWDVASCALLQTGSGYAMAFSPDGKQLASSNTSHMGRALYARAPTAFSPDNKQLALRDDRGIKLRDTVSGALLQSFKGDFITSRHHWLSFSPDGKQLASASKETTIHLWDVASGVLLRNLELHPFPGMSEVFSSDDKQLASVSRGNFVKVWLWDPASGVFSPDSKRLASGSQGKTIKLWDTASGVLLQSLQGHSNRVVSIAFSLNSKKLASGSHDKTIRLWNTRTGDHLQTLKAHSGSVNAMAFSPDGKQLASASEDKTIKLWDVASGSVQQTFDTGGAISWVSFRKENAYLETNKGLIKVQRSQADISPLRTQSTRCYFLKNNWITRDNEYLLWLPFEYRARVSDWRDGVLAFVNASSRITLFQSSFESV
ncbi:MAG: hypothetical protein M1821_003489 [Bathelium mastoideum]|nr:MAG: hypothetical protein M1821_003489 [Bathelium mastoideum]